jgi:hypothetical protein
VTYFRDIRDASKPTPTENWQTFWQYVEVSLADISKVSLWLNVYDASGPINGIVHVRFDGKVVDEPFRFDVARGNRGNDNRLETRRHSPYRQEIRLAEMIKASTRQISHLSPMKPFLNPLDAGWTLEPGSMKVNDT